MHCTVINPEYKIVSNIIHDIIFNSIMMDVKWTRALEVILKHKKMDQKVFNIAPLFYILIIWLKYIIFKYIFTKYDLKLYK